MTGGVNAMKALVFGETGQLAKCLQDSQPANLHVDYLNRQNCDLESANEITAALDARQPDWVINAAAYTAVDKAEDEPGLAKTINAEAPKAMAEWVAQSHAARKETAPKLIHISTDFVFDGTATEPYKPADPSSPLGAYGHSKREGELEVLSAAADHAMIIRTAWVYSEHGSNFVKTMLRLMAERDNLGVVDDQRGSPTYARGLAEVVWALVLSNQFSPGVFHWTDRGQITWYEFACEIRAEALELGLLINPAAVEPIPTSSYPTPAERPQYSVLDCTDLEQILDKHTSPWRPQLVEMLGRL